jgi:hypothetical protein
MGCILGETRAVYSATRRLKGPTMISFPANARQSYRSLYWLARKSEQ